MGYDNSICIKHILIDPDSALSASLAARSSLSLIPLPIIEEEYLTCYCRQVIRLPSITSMQRMYSSKILAKIILYSLWDMTTPLHRVHPNRSRFCSSKILVKIILYIIWDMITPFSSSTSSSILILHLASCYGGCLNSCKY